MDWNLMQTLPYSDELPTGFKDSDQQIGADVTTSSRPVLRTVDNHTADLAAVRPVRRP